MPRAKTPQQFYGLRLLLMGELAKYIRRKGYDFSVASNPDMPRGKPITGAALPNRDDVLTLIRVAKSPRDLLRPISCAATVKSFSILFAKWPDEVLDILRFIRERLAYTGKNQSGRVKWFLRTHRYIRDSKGKEIAVADMTDCDIARYLTRPGLTVPTDSVKKARQAITREDRETYYWEHPQRQEFLRTGAVIIDGERVYPPDPRLEHLFPSPAKGKK
jgi:hypothetical protein